MRFAARAVAASVFACAIAACRLFVDLDGLTGGAAATDGGPSSADGGGSTDGAVSPDAKTTEGGTPDAGPACPPYVLPASCDAQYLSDPRNCCIAGRDCGGGTCVSGKCQPVTIVADATSDARLIGRYNDTLVWATGCTNQLRRVRTDGAGNTPLPAGAHCTPTLALNGDGNAYWIEYNGPSLNKAPIDGTQPSSVIATVPGSGTRSDFARLAVDATRAYWATTTPAAVWFSPLSATGGAPTAIAKTGTTTETAQAPFGVAVDATDVYWSDTSENTVKRRSLASLGMNLLADVISTDVGPRDVTLDATRVYWLTSDGFVRARAKDLKDPAVTLASGQTAAESILTDDRYVYWTTWTTNGGVSRVPKTGGAVEPIATGQSYPYGITQDCGTIYWTNHANFNTGQVMKVVK